MILCCNRSRTWKEIKYRSLREITATYFSCLKWSSLSPNDITQWIRNRFCNKLFSFCQDYIFQSKTKLWPVWKFMVITRSCTDNLTMSILSSTHTGAFSRLLFESILRICSQFWVCRACFSKMAEELCELLMNSPGEGLTPDLYMGCFQTMLNAPVPDDHRSSYLQEAVSVFTDILCRDWCMIAWRSMAFYDICRIVGSFPDLSIGF